MKTDFQKLEDKLDQALVLARESVNPSHSKLFMEMNKRMEGIEKRLVEHAEKEEHILQSILEDQQRKHQEIDAKLVKLEPAIDGIAAAKTLRTGAIWLVGFIAAIIGLVEYAKWLRR